MQWLLEAYWAVGSAHTSEVGSSTLQQVKVNLPSSVENL